MWRFYRWYDRLQEPWRFLSAMIMVMVGIAAAISGEGIVVAIGVIYLVLLVVTRMIYVTFYKPRQNKQE